MLSAVPPPAAARTGQLAAWRRQRCMWARPWRLRCNVMPGRCNACACQDRPAPPAVYLDPARLACGPRRCTRGEAGSCRPGQLLRGEGRRRPATHLCSTAGAGCPKPTCLSISKVLDCSLIRKSIGYRTLRCCKRLRVGSMARLQARLQRSALLASLLPAPLQPAPPPAAAAAHAACCCCCCCCYCCCRMATRPGRGGSGCLA